VNDEQPADIFDEDSAALPVPPISPAVINQSIIVWRDGAPFPATRPVLARNQVNELIVATASLPYDGPEPRYSGMSNMEVALARRAEAMARGDDHALDETLDRILGKAKQSVEKLNLNMNYEDWLKAQAEDESDVINTTDDPPDENGL